MYNNPFYGMGSMYPYAAGTMPAKIGLFAKLKNGINWGSLLNNTSKTLNVINQAIPVIYQVKPLVQNAKTMFKIANIIKSDDTSKSAPVPLKNQSNVSSSNVSSNSKKEEYTHSSNQPTFFL